MKYLSKVANRPKKPLVLILGGAKISDKIAVLERLIRQADKVLIGGGVANVFLKALSVPVGASFVEDVFVDKARRAQVSSVKLAKKIYKQHRHKILLPVDLIAGTALDKRAMVETIDLESTHNIRPNWKFLDIGPHTIAQYMAEIKRAGTIFWNGPMGVFELEKFGYGTKKIAQAVARSKAVSVLGGGDTENVVALYGLEGKFDHVSTGGGASLEFLAHGTMPVLQELAKLDRGIFKMKKMRKTRQKLRRTRPAAT